MTTELDDCTTCCEKTGEKNECQKSQRPCGHHCNHSWSHEECCWCGKKWEDFETQTVRGEVI